MVEWKWVEGGIQFDGSMHSLIELPAAKAAAVVNGMDRCMDVLSMLRSAKQSFQIGRAWYAGAGENYSALLGELASQERLWEAGYEGLGSLFAPSLPMGQLDPSVRAQFAYETLLQLSQRVNTPAPEKK